MTRRRVSNPLAHADPRQVRSRRAMVEAMTEVLDSALPVGDVTITEVVRRAGVARPTFYEHFGEIPVLVRAAALARLEDTFDRVPSAALGDSWTTFAQGSFRTMLSDLRDHSTFYQKALERAGWPLVCDMSDFLAAHLLEDSPLGPVIRRRRGPDTPAERAQFLAAGAVRLVAQWLDTDFVGRNSVDSMVERLSVLLVAASGATEAEIEAVRTESDLQQRNRRSASRRRPAVPR